MIRNFGRSAALIVGLALVARTAGAAETPQADASLENEINHYLEQAATPADDPHTVWWKWSSGLKGTSADGNFELKIGGRLMADWAWLGGGDNVPVDTTDYVFFRRIRFYMSGTVYKNAIYKVQLDFAKGDEIEFKDVYVGLKHLPVGTLKVGNHHEPFCMETLTSSKYITFMERSMPANAFAPDRHHGISVSGDAVEKKLTYALGVFRDTDAFGTQVQNGGYNITARLTYLVLQDDDQGMLVHVGAAVSYRSPDGDTVRYRARPGTGMGDRIVDTGSITGVDDVTLLGFELGANWKSLSLSAELITASVSSTTAGDPNFLGWYVEISYFITGESRAYKGGLWDRVKPGKNFHDGGDGMGAWQVAFRIDSLDLNDANVTGGKAMTYTIGANWYWNPNMRVMFNFVIGDLDEDGADNVNVFEMRWQADF